MALPCLNANSCRRINISTQYFRISGTLEPTEGPVPPSLEGPVEHYIMPGTRRLDMDVAEYEYVDTFPPRLYCVALL